MPSEDSAESYRADVNGLMWVRAGFMAHGQANHKIRWRWDTQVVRRQAFKLFNEYAGFCWRAAPRVGCASPILSLLLPMGLKAKLTKNNLAVAQNL